MHNWIINIQIEFKFVLRHAQRVRIPLTFAEHLMERESDCKILKVGQRNYLLFSCGGILLYYLRISKIRRKMRERKEFGSSRKYFPKEK